MRMVYSSRMFQARRLTAIVVVTGIAISEIAWVALGLSAAIESWVSGCCAPSLPFALWGIALGAIALAWILLRRVGMDADGE